MFGTLFAVHINMIHAKAVLKYPSAVGENNGIERLKRNTKLNLQKVTPM